MELDLFPWKFEASVEVDGSCHCRWEWKLPLLPSAAASTTIFGETFHELPHTYPYILQPTFMSFINLQYSWLPQDFHKMSTDVQYFHELPCTCTFTVNFQQLPPTSSSFHAFPLTATNYRTDFHPFPLTSTNFTRGHSAISEGRLKPDFGKCTTMYKVYLSARLNCRQCKLRPYRWSIPHKQTRKKIGPRTMSTIGRVGTLVALQPIRSEER